MLKPTGMTVIWSTYGGCVPGTTAPVESRRDACAAGAEAMRRGVIVFDTGVHWMRAATPAENCESGWFATPLITAPLPVCGGADTEKFGAVPTPVKKAPAPVGFTPGTNAPAGTFSASGAVAPARDGLTAGMKLPTAPWSPVRRKVRPRAGMSGAGTKAPAAGVKKLEKLALVFGLMVGMGTLS